MILLLVSAAVAIGLEILSPSLGTLVWVAFPVIAFLIARQAESGASQ